MLKRKKTKLQEFYIYSIKKEIEPVYYNKQQTYDRVLTNQLSLTEYFQLLNN